MQHVEQSALASQATGISFFERYLTVWVALCIVGGICVGQWMPTVFEAIGNVAPLVAMLLGLSAITVPRDTLMASVALYIVFPVVIAQFVQRALLAKGLPILRFRTMHCSMPC
jgi:ACR3 family arsenite efflux pump ArsB